jgi:hypothetical protein
VVSALNAKDALKALPAKKEVVKKKN